MHSFGPHLVPFRKWIPEFVKLLSDQNPVVREGSITALEQMYQYIGEELKTDLRKYKEIRSGQLKDIFQRFAELSVNEQLMSMTDQESSPGKKKQGKDAHKQLSLDMEQLIQGSGISPMVCNNEKDLHMEIDKIREVLSNKKGDWNKRVDSLRDIQALVGGGASYLPNFIPLLHSIKEAIATQVCPQNNYFAFTIFSPQVTDLRSAIVKEACATISILAKAMRDFFEPFADFFIPILLKLTIVTIEVISESGNSCIKTIITHCKLGKTISKIVDNCHARHRMTRTRCTEYILLLLESASVATLESYVTELEDCIKTGIQDALPDVRMFARKCYWAFAYLLNDRATKFVNNVFDTFCYFTLK